MGKKKFNMYKKAGCLNCNGRGERIVAHTYGEYCTVYDKLRCDCTYRKTKKYKKALKSKHLIVKKYEKLLSKFKDNYSHIKDNFHSTYRSW